MLFLFEEELKRFLILFKTISAMFDNIEKGMKLKDLKTKESGKIRWCEDLHNVHVECDDGSIKFYCLVKECKRYYPHVEIK